MKSLNLYSAYYSTQLHRRDYGVVVLFYSTTFSSAGLPEDILLARYNSVTYKELLQTVGNNSGEPGLAGLTLALEADKRYGPPEVGHYNTSNISGTHDYGIYAIWKKKEQT